MRKKPNFTAHYLVLVDLINGVDVRAKVDFIHYLTSRIENIKNSLKNTGLRFKEDAKTYTEYSWYKPYILIDDEENMKLAHTLLNEKYGTANVVKFLGLNSSKDESQKRRN